MRFQLVPVNHCYAWIDESEPRFRGTYTGTSWSTDPLTTGGVPRSVKKMEFLNKVLRIKSDATIYKCGNIQKCGKQHDGLVPWQMVEVENRQMKVCQIKSSSWPRPWKHPGHIVSQPWGTEFLSTAKLGLIGLGHVRSVLRKMVFVVWTHRSYLLAPDGLFQKQMSIWNPSLQSFLNSKPSRETSQLALMKKTRKLKKV